MTYCDPSDVRDLVGMSEDDADDDVLSGLIEKAQYVILHYIQIAIIDEEADLDASGTTIQVSNAFIADIDFDSMVGTLDVAVYGWTDADHIDSRIALDVSTIWPDQGIIKLASSANAYPKVTVNYSYYTCSIDWNLLNMATAYYAGMLWVAKEEFLVPDELTIGNVRVRQKQPWDKLRTEFLRIIYHITSIPMDITNYRKMVLSPRSREKFSGPGTTYMEEDDGLTQYPQGEGRSDSNVQDDEDLI